MLCATCVSIFQTKPVLDVFPTIRGQHHASIKHVEAAAKQGCYLCSELILDYDYEEDQSQAPSRDNGQSTALTFELRLAHSVISPHGRLGELSFDSVDGRLASAGYEIVYTEDLQIPQEYNVFLEQAKADLNEEPWRVRNDGFPSSLAAIPQSTGDPAVLKIAKDWLSSCLETHTSCSPKRGLQDSTWYPKRLLDLSSGTGQRIILTGEEPPTGPYATLSHCWGTNPSICCLTAENAEDWKRDIPSELLTKTLRDAIATARMLGIRYIWVDSMCILQAGSGSKDDWQLHSESMRLVYSHALVNIAAARAENGTDGAFTTRSDLFLRPCHVLWNWPSRFHKYVDDPFWTIRKAWRHQAHGIRTLPLYTRGWVVQERFLASRVLHFGRDRIFWECTELSMVEESFPRGFGSSCPEYKTVVDWPFNIDSSTRDASLSTEIQPVRNPMWALWQEMLNEYTRCDLSFPDKDIFVAISGIAEKFGKHFDHQYVAGLFRQHLPFDLLWQNKGERSEIYRAPTWSWASIDGGVQFAAGDCPYCDECCQRFATVKDARAALAHENSIYGPVKSAELVLKGYLFPCRIQPASTPGTGLRQKMTIYPGVEHSGAPSFDLAMTGNSPVSFGEADIDEEKDSMSGFDDSTGFTAWALPIIEFKVAPSNSYAKHWGLIVEKTLQGKYERAGIYRVQGWVMEKILEEKCCVQQDVCLI
jgi:hypothetical protein